ncbi:hypothetical protein [Devosia aquimaris]|uniref:hypothetical protein n=1 Tax=Devosia aquimaris TaxID=2866214 RepID=UPI001CD0EEA2|nr:hypothetical protein [Devosia sp. CJK-A8-3]
MRRTIAVLSLALATPAMAADYPELLRPAYPETWQNPDSALRFEFGTRYWMSWGEQDAGFTAVDQGVTLGNVGISTRDQTQIGELHGKIEDLSTQTYVDMRAGLGLYTTGTYNISPAASGSIGRNSSIGYAGADFGWLPFGNMTDGAAIGGLVGYQYWKDAPDIGTGQYAASFAGGVPATYGPAKDNFDIHALRLGVKGQARVEQFDIQGEVAAVPYAHVSGTVGGSAPGGFNFPGIPVTFYERAPTTLTGRGYGVMAEGMVGFHPTENLVLRVGGRAWYLEGQLETQFHSTSALGNSDLNLPSNFARIFRYGALFEVAGTF